MSLIRLGSAATRRRLALAAGGSAAASGAGIAVGTVARPAAITTVPETETETERAFQQLVQYIPTETVTLFLAAVSLVNSVENVWWIDFLGPFHLIAIFALLTPAMLLTAAYATFRESRKANTALTEVPFQVPWFDLFASAIAFVPWALAVPGLFSDPAAATTGAAMENDVSATGLTTESAQVFAAFLAFAVSWLLSQARRILT